MNEERERRSNPRVRFCWPLWFGYEETGEFKQGQIADLNQRHVSFTTDCRVTPSTGASVLVRFSYPCGNSGAYDINSYYYWADVIRIDPVEHHRSRVALRLQTDLPVNTSRPAESLESVLSA